MFFGPGTGKRPLHRFDPTSGRFGVLYVGLSFEAAFVETLLRNPNILSVRVSELERRSVSSLRSSRLLRAVKMYDDGLSRLGVDNAISTGPYEPCGLWSDALWDHREIPDGIAYRSRHDTGQVCLALFERDRLELAATTPEPLMSRQHEIQRLLVRYGKSLGDDSVR